MALQYQISLRLPCWKDEIVIIVGKVRDEIRELPTGQVGKNALTKRKMNCLLSMSMPNPLTTCFEVKQNLGIRECNASTSDSHLVKLCETHR